MDERDDRRSIVENRCETKVFHSVAQVPDIPPGGNKAFDLNGISILICNSEGEFFAIDNKCSHASYPWRAGVLEDATSSAPNMARNSISLTVNTFRRQRGQVFAPTVCEYGATRLRC